MKKNRLARIFTCIKNACYKIGFWRKENKVISEWISVKEKLPNDNQEYICYGEDWAGYPIFSAIHDEQGWFIMNGKQRMRQFPTHWKPNPPKTVL